MYPEENLNHLFISSELVKKKNPLDDVKLCFIYLQLGRAHLERKHEEAAKYFFNRSSQHADKVPITIDKKKLRQIEVDYEMNFLREELNHLS